MSEALERVIAEQQAEIDRYKAAEKTRFSGLFKHFVQLDTLAHAAFRIMDKETIDQGSRDALRDALRGLDYCTRCEQSVCECERQYD